MHECTECNFDCPIAAALIFFLDKSSGPELGVVGGGGASEFRWEIGDCDNTAPIAHSVNNKHRCNLFLNRRHFFRLTLSTRFDRKIRPKRGHPVRGHRLRKVKVTSHEKRSPDGDYRLHARKVIMLMRWRRIWLLGEDGMVEGRSEKIVGGIF